MKNEKKLTKEQLEQVDGGYRALSAVDAVIYVRNEEEDAVIVAEKANAYFTTTGAVKVIDSAAQSVVEQGR